jgi:YHS domain-containing protein
MRAELRQLAPDLSRKREARLAARHRATHQGHDYFFCNPRRREKFLADAIHFFAA